ncbi:Chaperone modulatory protein CbpM [Microbulbifer aggregans]|uniref:Chaperone modulatory protein CbpM n=1 Tax=Microbulbifer aggregans TaxID=1769779 RepID=A0A1C9W5Q7_9GAMM|nr:chaperone modulator CbpM [Microbulbifer aggregans]AOS96473.1 Chaperone modulatory protein CbpM [Microbulbifer aggregans]
MANNNQREITGPILDEESELTLAELCRACGMPAEQVIALVEEGIIEPRGSRTRWRFSGICVRRVRKVYTLERDLGVNLAGAALALDLLEEIEQLRARLQRLERKR